jgi:hypothetical protein
MASRWSRLTSAVSGAIRSIFGTSKEQRRPPTPPSPPPGPPPGGIPPRPPAPPPRPPEPPGGPTMPPPGGGGIGGGGIGDDPGWYGNEITLYDADGNPIPEGGGWTMAEWHDELLRTKGELVADYGLGNIDLIYQLLALGIWDEEDWVQWREDYEEAYG